MMQDPAKIFLGNWRFFERVKFQMLLISIAKVLIYAFLFTVVSISINAQSQHPVQIYFHHTVSKQILELGKEYQNHAGETFSIRKFRYYVSNIRFYDTVKNRSYLLKNNYFLIDESKPDSKTISLNIPMGAYQKFSFIIGVDSIRNVSGAQARALDPLNDMFWTWRSGYVMAKLEGHSPVSTLPHLMFEYHIGGFSGPNSVLQTTDLELLTPAIADNSKKQTVINVLVDVNAWFSAAHELPIANTPACTAPGELAKKYAENFVHMFSVQSDVSE